MKARKSKLENELMWHLEKLLEKFTNGLPHEKLFIAIIIKAVDDAFTEKVPEKHKISAKEFLDQSKPFKSYCFALGLDPIWIGNMINNIGRIIKFRRAVENKKRKEINNMLLSINKVDSNGKKSETLGNRL